MSTGRAQVKFVADVDDQAMAGLEAAAATAERLGAWLDEHPHVITWSISKRGQLQGRLICEANPEARCHWWPTCDCEYLIEVGLDDGGPFHIAVEYPSDHGYPEDLGYDEVRVRHAMEYGETCRIADYVNADPEVLAENIAATAGAQVGVGRTRVDLAWNGDFYEWTPVGA